MNKMLKKLLYKIAKGPCMGKIVGYAFQISEERFIRYFAKVWEAVKDISAKQPEYHDGFVIVANGGKRQEVQQVHFHMFTNDSLFSTSFRAKE